LVQVPGADERHIDQCHPFVAALDHLKLAAIAGLPSILDQLRVVFDHWDRIRRFFFEISPERDASKAQREHLAMIRALEKREGDRLRDLLYRHNDRARLTYLKLLQAQGGARGTEKM